MTRPSLTVILVAIMGCGPMPPPTPVVLNEARQPSVPGPCGWTDIDGQAYCGGEPVPAAVGVTGGPLHMLPPAIDWRGTSGAGVVPTAVLASPAPKCPPGWTLWRVQNKCAMPSRYAFSCDVGYTCNRDPPCEEEVADDGDLLCAGGRIEPLPDGRLACRCPKFVP